MTMYQDLAKSILKYKDVEVDATTSIPFKDIANLLLIKCVEAEKNFYNINVNNSKTELLYITAQYIASQTVLPIIEAMLNPELIFNLGIVSDKLDFINKVACNVQVLLTPNELVIDADTGEDSFTENAGEAPLIGDVGEDHFAGDYFDPIVT